MTFSMTTTGTAKPAADSFQAALRQQAALADRLEQTRHHCQSVYSAPGGSGSRTIRHLHGQHGLHALNASAHNPQEGDAFKAHLMSSRFGPLLVGFAAKTPHHKFHAATNFGHNHPVSRLLIVTSGQLTVSLGGTRLSLEPGAGVLIPGTSTYSHDARCPVSFCYIDVDTSDPVFSTVGALHTYANWPGDTQVLAALGAFTSALINSGRAQGDYRQCAQVRQALEALVLTVVASAPPMTCNSETHLTTHDLAVAYLRQHHSDPSLTPATLAQAIGVRPRTLQRAFEHDQPVAQHLARLRLEHALSLLRDSRYSNLTLDDVAGRCGYHATVTLRRAVHAATGEAPTRYRARHRSQG
ncbi:MAG: helix-turn-helix domain-containing protein [Cellulomonadaceae bacterium]|jgi:AraC-like DNA-binding protein/mannose-6-phosphate isomerase-like protein (cupin superfamily)|nr:helix-turn-helix domain-containing protein [Cellulomonadaceae bacterium]